MTPINRRCFLKIAGTGAFGLGIARVLISAPQTSGSRYQEVSTPRIQKYNRLGKTGLEVSDIGFGAINYFNPSVLRYAFDLGINFFDTAEAYMRTLSETYLGQTLKDVRHKVIFSTKYGISGPGEMKRNAIIKRVESSLRRLQTDYIDITMLHQVSDPAVLTNEEVLAAHERLKRDGKVRFTGFSTHVAEKVFSPLLETASSDIVLFVYNHMEGAALESLIEKVRAKGVGTIAMKALAGNKQGSLKGLVNEQRSYSQAALGWVLANPNIDCCVITMNTFSHVEEYVAASGKQTERKTAGPLAKYRREAGSLYCRVGCRECLGSCPERVAVNDVLRGLMYYEDYRMESGAADLYQGLSDAQKPNRCGGCPAPCEEACPFGLPVKERLLQARRLLSA